MPKRNSSSSPLDEQQPSTCTDRYWLFARRKQGTYPDATENNGKWMVFVPVEQVDEWWATIKQAVEEGKLGGEAKVATARPSPLALSDRKRVICVYTYDGVNDKEDTMRVREALRALGVTSPISCKLDSATIAGVYSKTGGRVSLYRV